MITAAPIVTKHFIMYAFLTVARVTVHWKRWATLHPTAGWAVAREDSDWVAGRASAAPERERDPGPAEEGRDRGLDSDLV